MKYFFACVRFLSWNNEHKDAFKRLFQKKYDHQKLIACLSIFLKIPGCFFCFLSWDLFKTSNKFIARMSSSHCLPGLEFIWQKTTSWWEISIVQCNEISKFWSKNIGQIPPYFSYEKNSPIKIFFYPRNVDIRFLVQLFYRYCEPALDNAERL